MECKVQGFFIASEFSSELAFSFELPGIGSLARVIVYHQPTFMKCHLQRALSSLWSDTMRHSAPEIVTCSHFGGECQQQGNNIPEKTIAFQSCFIMLFYWRTLLSKTCICCAPVLFCMQPLIRLPEMLLTWQRSECEGHANYVKECNSFFGCDCHASSPFLCGQTLFFIRSCSNTSLITP